MEKEREKNHGSEKPCIKNTRNKKNKEKTKKQKETERKSKGKKEKKKKSCSTAVPSLLTYDCSCRATRNPMGADGMAQRVCVRYGGRQSNGEGWISSIDGEDYCG